MVGLDNTIVNIALPSIGRDLHARVSGLQWIVDAYLLVLASVFLLSGSMADRVGRRRIFQIGLLLFTLGSLLCSLAPSLALLVVFRMLQATGGSMLIPVTVSIITHTFADRRERAQALGIWASMFGVSLALGPVVGGLLVNSAGWRSIFWINIPIGLIASVLAARYVPESKAPRPRRIDLVGQLLVITVLATLIFGIIEGAGFGWVSARILLSFSLAGACFAGLLLCETRRNEPLIELRFFRSVSFSAANIIAICAFAALGGYLFMNTLYLQEVRGLSAFHAGLDTLPMAVMVAIWAPISGRIVGWRGARIPLMIAGSGIAASCMLFTHLSSHTPLAWLFVSYVLFGIGFGAVNAPTTNLSVSGMPLAQVGVAAALSATSRQVGQSLGVAVVGALAASSVHGSFRSDFAAASHVGWWALVGCGLAIVCLGVVATTPSARRSAERSASRFRPTDQIAEDLVAPQVISHRL